MKNFLAQIAQNLDATTTYGKKPNAFKLMGQMTKAEPGSDGKVESEVTNALILHDEGYFTEIGYDYNKTIQPLVEYIKAGSNYASKEEALKDKAP